MGKFTTIREDSCAFVAEVVEEYGLDALGWEDVLEAVRQLDAGETRSRVQQRLLNWDEDYAFEGMADGQNALATTDWDFGRE